MTVWAWLPAYTVAATDEAGTPLPAVAFDPLPSALARLAALGLIFRPRPGGFALFARHVGGKDGVRQTALPGETLLSFAIRLADDTFPGRFKPKLSRTIGVNLYLTNRATADTVRPSGRLTRGNFADDADACRVVARCFPATVNLSAGPAPTKLTLATSFTPTRALPDVTVELGAGEAAVPVNLTPAPERAFTYAATPPGDAPRLVIADDEAAGQGIFGLLDLYLRKVAGPDPAGGRAFTAKFRRQI